MAPATKIQVKLPITLGQFVKAAGLATTGGEAKMMVTTGMVRLNGAVEMRRGKKLALGDVVALGGAEAVVAERG